MNRLRRSQLSRQLLMQYGITLIGFVVVCVILFFSAAYLYSRYSFQSYDFIYILAQLYARYFLFFNALIFLIGWVIITYYFISKPLHYLDEVVHAAQQLTKQPNEPVNLSHELRGTEDELNLLRIQAIRSAAAAKDAEQRKHDLIVYLAHDLKTPLTSIIGYLTLLQDEPHLSQEMRARYTGIALSKAERLEDLINEFFEITRFNLASLQLELERTNLSRMLDQILSEFTPILAEKELQWLSAIEPNVELVCDPNKLERVFDNLLRNAINYAYAKSTISVQMHQQEQQVAIVIRNQGKTIPADKLEKIFEQFFRLDASRSAATGGAGLGLAISKEIVELHQGSIKAESAEESITFTVLLPLTVRKS